MIVRVIVSFENRGGVSEGVHATRYEPFVDDAHGRLIFDVPYSKVLTFLDSLAQSGVGRFLAHLRLP